uniref:Ran GTPase-activating protein n=1 Tax=Globodera rostochiensis TaxID=31243 RepID=A0A914H7C9_GLORO
MRFLTFAGLQLKMDNVYDGEKIAEKIRECPGLEVLEMRGNTLGVDATAPIAEALESQYNLKRALWSDLFTGRFKEEIPRTLKTLCDAMTLSGARLTELDLSDNAIGPMAVPGIKDFLAGEAAFALQTLKLNNCGLGIAGTTVAHCLLECHRRSAIQGTPLSLKTFIAGRNRLEYTSTAALAEAFKIIGTLEEIAMPQNGISAKGILKLSEAIRLNPALRYLNLGDNTFGESGANAMASALENLSELELVDFSDCLCRDRGSIRIAHSLVASKSPLRELNLSGNEITIEAAKKISRAMNDVTGIQLLKIGVNCFGSQFNDFLDFVQPIAFIDAGTESDDQGSLSDFDEFVNESSEKDIRSEVAVERDIVIDSAYYCSSLSFAGHQLKLNSMADGEKIAEKIRECPGLEVLEMRGNTLGVDATAPIAEALESQYNLKRALWSDLFTGRFKEEIPRTLKTLCDAMTLSGARLTELDLSDNAIGPMAVPGIKDFLAGEAAFALQTLKLNNCGLGIAGTTVAHCLLECHRRSAIQGTPLSLKTFIAGRNRLEYTSTAALAEAFKIIGTLEEIAMPQNGISAKGILKLSEAIRLNPALRYLNLGDNTFGESGANAMASALENLSELELVDFSDCLCRDRGSIRIAHSLVASKSPLRELNLSGNEITIEAAKKISRAMNDVTGIQLLKIGVNCFGSQFNDFLDFVQPIAFIDAGTESDDQGSLSDTSQ